MKASHRVIAGNGNNQSIQHRAAYRINKGPKCPLTNSGAENHQRPPNYLNKIIVRRK